MRATTSPRSPSTRTCTSRRSRRRPATYGPVDGLAARSCSSWSPPIRATRRSRPMRHGDGQTTYGLQIQPRVGFFTDTSVCIGCKACEVACKEWNLVPEDGLVWSGNSYDNTGELSANTWRHVAFIEQQVDDGFRWLMSSDVCKHCTHAGCLDVCPTGAITRTEFGTVVIQDDVCNGCGYCVTACPFGVISKREIGGDGGMHKCTLCYD